MDFFTFISNVVDSLAWPGLIFMALWIFKKPLGELIDAIKNAKFKIEKNGTTVEAELFTVRKSLEGLKVKQAPSDIKKLSESSPAEAINISWKNLEQKAKEAALSSNEASPIEIAGTLINKKIFSPEEGNAFYKMYEIREKAKESGGKEITDVSSASTYSDIAFGLSKKIELSGKAVSSSSASGTLSFTEPKDKESE